jgi:hypothetical protein
MAKTSLYVISLGVRQPDTFDKFADSWWHAVERMTPMPDEIVICATIGNTCKILEVPEFAKNKTSIVYVNPNEPMSTHLNTAVEHCTGKWISWIGIDDLPLENLFSSVAVADRKNKDIILSGIKTTSGKVIYSDWEQLAQSKNNTVMGNTVCTKALWEKVGGYPNIYFNDWGFWLYCHSLKPKIYKTKFITMLFNDSEDYSRRSGLKNFDKFEEAMIEIEKIKSELKLKIKLGTRMRFLFRNFITNIKKIVKRFLD